MVSAVRDVLRLTVDRRSTTTVGRPDGSCATHLTPHRSGRRERATSLRLASLSLAPLLIVALRHVAAQCRALFQHGHRLGVVKHVHITHAMIRRMSLHLFLQRPAAHDLLCDLSLQRERRASNVAIFLILPNTQRSDKV